MTATTTSTTSTTRSESLIPATVRPIRPAVAVSEGRSPFHRVGALHGWTDKTARDRCYAALALLCELVEAARGLGRPDQVAAFVRPLDDLLATPAAGTQDLDNATRAAAEADAEEDLAEAAWAHERRRNGKAGAKSTLRLLRARARCHEREKTMNILAAREAGLHA